MKLLYTQKLISNIYKAKENKQQYSMRTHLKDLSMIHKAIKVSKKVNQTFSFKHENSRMKNAKHDSGQ
jgi:hypothetical protein